MVLIKSMVCLSESFSKFINIVGLAVDLEVKFLFTVVKTNAEVADLKSTRVFESQILLSGSILKNESSLNILKFAYTL